MEDQKKPVSLIAATTPSSSPAASSGPQSEKERSKPPLHSDSTLSKDDELPNNVTTTEQLAELPSECLSGDKERPLRHVDEEGNISHHALKPMLYSVILILMVELLERFCFYGVNYTQTAYLTGVYDENWNANFSSVQASTYVSVSVAVAYTTPFLGAFFADSIFGDYYSLLIGALCFYLPGLLLIALTTIPGFLGETFNSFLLAVGLILLWPMGTGIVKSIVNVFGAKQFHPLLQSASIESYYVSFYMCINIGALVGGVLIPLMAQINITTAYFIPVGMLALAVLCFLSGTSKYVRQPPKGDLCSKKKKKKKFAPVLSEEAKKLSLWTVFKISMMVVPFNIAYAQMATTFIIQGTVMQKLGFIDAACMNNADAVSVLFFGYIIGQKMYPALADRGIKIPTTYKFAIGSFLGALAIAWSLLMEYMIHWQFNETGEKISIMWQAMSYILVGVGEIFAVSAAYEAAFQASLPEQKALASAVNLFCVGGLPNVFCIFLYQACRHWFMNSSGTTAIHHLEDYAEAHVWKYFFVLFLIAFFGVMLNLLPASRRFVETVEAAAIEVIKTPKTPSRPPRHKRMDSWDFSDAKKEEMSPLIRAKRHQAYLKYGSGPVMVRNSSMRAGPSLSQKGKKGKNVKRSAISKLYNSEPVIPKMNVLLDPSGRPVQAGSLHGTKDDQVGMTRSASSDALT